MPFPWVAVGMGLLQVGSSLYQSSQQNAAAATSKKEAKKIARDQYARAQVEYEISLQQDATNYAWDLARTEAQRFMDNQRAADYKTSQMNLYDQALDNLTLNTSALLDKYELEEGLRAKQTQNSMKELSDTSKLTRAAAVAKAKVDRKGVKLDEKLNRASTLRNDIKYQNQRKNLATQARANAEQSNAAVRQYLTSVKSRRLEGQALVSGLENQISSLQAEQTNEMSTKQLERNIRVVASMMDQGAARASSGQRGGGSATARRLAMNDAQKLGRSYGEIQMLKQKQGYQIESMNADMAGEKALKLKQLARLMQGDVEQSRKTIKRTRLANAVLKRQQDSIFTDRSIAKREFNRNSQQNRNKLRGQKNVLKDTNRKINQDTKKMRRNMNIVEKGFQVAARQGQRDLTGLYISTQGSIDQASMPYRKSIIFDPLEPIAGLPPEKNIPTFNTPQSPINSYANAILGGVQQGLQYSKMTPDGLKFY